MTTTTKPSYDIQALKSLVERLRAAEGPDRCLDAEIDATLRIGKPNHKAWVRDNFPMWRARPDGRCEVVHSCGCGGAHWESEPLTSSIDAAVSLAESIVAKGGRKIICFFCAGGQLTPYNADKDTPDYHPLAKIDNSVTIGWMAHVAFYDADGGTHGPEQYSHGKTASLAILLALIIALISESVHNEQ